MGILHIFVNKSGIEKSVVDTAQTAGISMIQSITATHTAVTTAQKNAAINAIISSGNTKKLAIQNDVTIVANDKINAYAAIDKIVSDYEVKINAVTKTADLATLQSAGITAVNAYTVTGTPQTDATKTSSTDDTVKATTTTKKSTSTNKYVYATTSIKVYKSSTLKGKTIASYGKKTRQNRPTFQILKAIKNSAGKTVYQVKDLTVNKKGYITSSSSSVGNLYYQTKAAKVKVIDNKGVNRYKKSNLSGKTYHYKKGATIKVKSITKYKNATRFKLSNGQYITANKTFVITVG
ncbi:DUF5776 domain-containing protein [Secundilactobacillus paracollinoides]|uniref:DUF5776 domain-containing protein n=2 Tax=Secundilactobacillus paracollinoides TaxID=240427 RepID=A0A1B2IW82_9LACO|nr:DUF5776 domain-containing protein [Secundilactobacillus paracollinoides]ANZ66305.1 hypothetical protein AYR63_03575 [Secundilactobacillus paracollinoides]